MCPAYMEKTNRERTIQNIEYSFDEIKIILLEVIEAMKEKQYNPVNQLVGYILTGEPTYITGHKQARVKIQKIDRNVLLQMMVENLICEIDNNG